MDSSDAVDDARVWNLDQEKWLKKQLTRKENVCLQNRKEKTPQVPYIIRL